MNTAYKLIKHFSVKFVHDERGAFAVLFGVMAMVLVAVAGSCVDYSLFVQDRSKSQEALDAAVLALHDKIGKESTDALGKQAIDLVRERVGDKAVKISLASVSVDSGTGSIKISAHIDVPTYFTGLVGVKSIPATVVSEATRKSLNVEVAMVLDNSGSMQDYGRMYNLKDAAKNATDILMKANQTVSRPSVKVGVVPFTEFVNIGPDNMNKWWVDKAGRSPIASDNFSNGNAPAHSVNRIALFNQIQGESWRGCVEARPYPLDTADTPPSNQDPRTLFVPMFAPDEPDTPMYTNRWGSGPGYPNNYLPDDGGSCRPIRKDRWGRPIGKISDRQRQEQVCKYHGARIYHGWGYSTTGPNSDCPYNPLTELTADKSTVKTAISNMVANGGTNIAQGAEWGFHMLSPNAPLAGADAYDSATTKVMILMTDGNNFMPASSDMNGSTFYSAYGYPYNQRLGQVGQTTSQLEGEMDQRLLETCTNERNLGIKVYTIGLSMDRSKTVQMLKDCSSGDGYWFMPNDPSELNAVFKKIADKVSDLRLSR